MLSYASSRLSYERCQERIIFKTLKKNVKPGEISEKHITVDRRSVYPQPSYLGALTPLREITMVRHEGRALGLGLASL